MYIVLYKKERKHGVEGRSGRIKEVEQAVKAACITLGYYKILVQGLVIDMEIDK